MRAHSAPHPPHSAAAVGRGDRQIPAWPIKAWPVVRDFLTLPFVPHAIVGPSCIVRVSRLCRFVSSVSRWLRSAFEINETDFDEAELEAEQPVRPRPQRAPCQAAVGIPAVPARYPAACAGSLAAAPSAR